MPEKVALTTKAAVDALPYSRKGQGQTVHYCTELTGFGVRAGAREKTFVLWRRVNGKPRLIKLGRVGEISLQKARQDAQQLIGEMVGGTDPVARKRDQTAGGMTLRKAWALHQQAMRSKKWIKQDERRLSGQDRLSHVRLARPTPHRHHAGGL
jgi:hypothetical protein